MTESMNQYCVYGPGTADLPGVYVCRRFEVDRDVVPTGDHWTAETLEAVREQLPEGLVCLPRFPEDDPNIIEVWI
ncbi:hypothetical protein [Gimesia algae]|uniref:Uncharacterized protein n=1 Tax=Gimesia algae TaxID=2527971 RepID=A0A517VMP3_9PLAN|nr:hypothetical protein [Gimesia algae]QDT94288.1 hypothetical protein Pan161_59830 [Gimesia algae]